MSEFLYEYFLEDRRIYLAARAYWFRRVRQIVTFDKTLVPYLSERFRNGQLFYDGNPIFNIINTRTRKAVRIVQEDPREFDRFYSSWEQDRFLPFGTDFEPRLIREKVIVLTLTRDSVQRSLEELGSWLDG